MNAKSPFIDKAAKLLQDDDIKEFLTAKKWAPDDEVNEILLNANLFAHEAKSL